MSDLNDRLRDKTLQIAQLNQKLEVLQAQLGGGHRRANELGVQVETLTSEVTARDQEIQMLRSEVTRYKGALESVGQEMQSMKADQTQILSRKQPGGDDYSMKQDLWKLRCPLLMMFSAIRKVAGSLHRSRLLVSLRTIYLLIG